MAKQSVKAPTPTPEEVVAQNGGLEGTVTPAVENNANDVEEVGEEVVETAEVVTETQAPAAPEVQAPVETAPVVEETAERTMECLGLKNHTCRIGGNVITVTKDKVQTFSAGVATVLQRASVVIVK
jgi:hypothetical protein